MTYIQLSTCKYVKLLLKIYENIIKCRLVDSMYNDISLFISAYRESYNTQHVMIRGMERKFRQTLCRWRGIHEPIQSFHCVPQDLLHAKLAAYGVDKNVLFYIYS